MRAAATPQRFDAAALRRAIAGTQRGEVSYPELLRLSVAAISATT